MARTPLLILIVTSLLGFINRDAGRGKQFFFKDYYITGYTFNYVDEHKRPLRIMQYFLKGRDSVRVYHGQEMIASFQMKNGLISDSSLQEFDSGRVTREYTFSNRKGWYHVGTIGARRKVLYGRYPGTMTSEKEYWPNGKLKFERYIGESSADSVCRYWFSSGTLRLIETQVSRGEYDGNGHLKKMVYYYHGGGDSLINEWYPGGMIKRVWSDAREMKYYENGVLRELYAGSRKAYYDSMGIIIEEVNSDTLVEGRHLMYTREYAKGILHYEKFFTGFEKNIPCYVWREYDEHGKLLRIIKKPPLESMPIFENTVESSVSADQPEPIYLYVSQYPEYIGGRETLNTYLENALKSLDKKTLKKLKGTYQLNIRIHEDGKAGFISIEGFNYGRLIESMASIVESMKWKPARIDGGLIESEVRITFEAK